VTVPVVLHNDPEQHVLILQDLGHLPNLAECFSRLFYAVPAQAQREKSANAIKPPLSSADWVRIGQKIGAFFAGLHQPDNVFMIQRLPYEDPDFLKHDGMAKLVLEAAIKPVNQHLRLFPHLFSTGDVDRQYQCLEENFARRTEEHEKVIALGDCWPGALLVGLGNPEGSPAVSVIDWEFASIGRGVNGDMAQLLAHIQIMRIAAGWLGDEYSTAIDAMLHGLTSEYRRRSQAIKASWLAKSASRAPHATSPTAILMRSAFLAHGAEMINTAFWKDWVCGGEHCCTNGRKEKHTCKLVQRMTEAGWWYLYHAMENEARFVEIENWETVRQDTFIVPMFYETGIAEAGIL
jgi:Phosphotransferase enzyme family